MQSKLEKLIKLIYKKYKSDRSHAYEDHPDEESMACFLEGRLSEEESRQFKLHLINCERCSAVFAIQVRLTLASPPKAGTDTIEDKLPDPELIAHLKDLVKQESTFSILEILLKIKEKALELLHTTGDVVVGQELVPAPILRSRQIKDFRDEVNILKDFQDIRVEVKIENRNGRAFNLTVVAKEKQTGRTIKDLRVTLLRNSVELESYLADSGSVTFENVFLGKYTVEISTVKNKLASILVDVKA